VSQAPRRICKGVRHSERLYFFTFLLDTASAFLAERFGVRFCLVFWSGVSLGLDKTNINHARPEMSSPREIREGQKQLKKEN
jgi:hypothetical protein